VGGGEKEKRRKGEKQGEFSVFSFQSSVGRNAVTLLSSNF